MIFIVPQTATLGFFWFDRVSAETGADGMDPRTVVSAHETFAFSRSFIVPTQANNEDFPFSLEGVRQQQKTHTHTKTKSVLSQRNSFRPLLLFTSDEEFVWFGRRIVVGSVCRVVRSRLSFICRWLTKKGNHSS